MITIITGDDINTITQFMRNSENHRIIFRDEHPRELIKQAKQLVKEHGSSNFNLFVFTYNVTVIQALLYFSKIYKKPIPDVRFCTSEGWGVEKDLEKVFHNLVAPLDDLFSGKYVIDEGDKSENNNH